MKKTLGGDRLGAGKKMTVDLHNYSRSTHDLGYIMRTTMSSGTLVPFLCKVMLPGDTFDINLECDVKTHPTIGPLFGSYKVQLDTFLAPVRLYQGQLHNNKIGIGLNMNEIKLPLIQLIAKNVGLLPPDIDNAQINPSCVLNYVGIRGVGWTITDQTRDFNALAILTYWDIYKNYYSNKQEEIGAVIHSPEIPLVSTVTTVVKSPVINIPQYPTLTGAVLALGDTITVNYTGATPRPDQIYFILQGDGQLVRTVRMDDLLLGITDSGTALTGSYNFTKFGHRILQAWRYRLNNEITIGNPQVITFDLDNIDIMKESILANAGAGNVPFILNSLAIAPYVYLWSSSGGIPHMLSSQEGLAIKTYQSDLFNNWLNTEWIDGVGGINDITAVDVSGGELRIESLILQKKVYDMLNRIAVSGGSYDDWMDAVWAHERYTRCENPMYMGGLSKELIFQEVVSNSEASVGEGTQPLGTLAGKGIMGKKHKGGSVTVKADEPSYLIGIVSLTPRIDYSQGNEWDIHLKTMDDFHKPALDEIGFQELITEQMAYWATHYDGQWVQKSAGKQPAWINYMTSVNKVYGNFAIRDNEMFMTLNRRYEEDSLTTGILDLTTYIDPVKYNHIFANTAADAQNFWVQIAVDITARRKMSAKIMPNL